LTLSQCLERQERYVEPSRFDTMPSQPSLQACAKMMAPSPTNSVQGDALERLWQQAGEPRLAPLDRRPATAVAHKKIRRLAAIATARAAAAEKRRDVRSFGRSPRPRRKRSWAPSC
jgi:hypothetical protein